MVMLTPAAFWAWREAQARGWRPWERLSLAILVAAPGVTPLIAAATGLHPGALVTAFAFTALMRRALTPAPGRHDSVTQATGAVSAVS